MRNRALRGITLRKNIPRSETVPQKISAFYYKFQTIFAKVLYNFALYYTRTQGAEAPAGAVLRKIVRLAAVTGETAARAYDAHRSGGKARRGKSLPRGARGSADRHSRMIPLSVCSHSDNFFLRYPPRNNARRVSTFCDCDGCGKVSFLPRIFLRNCGRRGGNMVYC